jgi:hypothetical protein
MAEHKAKTTLSQHGAHTFSDWMVGWGVEPIAVFPPLVLLVTILALMYDPESVAATMTGIAAISPIWLPLILGRYFWITWMHYIRYEFWFSHEYVLLEIQLPPEVQKTPVAMEAVMAAMWQVGGETSVVRRIWNGRFRTTWSFEIASNEGKIGYYLHMRKSWQTVVEARIYGQYPEAKIFEVEDYTRKVPFNLSEYSLWGCEYRKGAPQALPIKTYVDYGLNMNPDKPENSVDPITNILELLGSIGKDEYYWIQIIARGHRPEEWYGFFQRKDYYVEEAQDKIKETLANIAKRSKEVGEEYNAGETARSINLAQPTEGERQRISKIQYSLGKMSFDCGIVAMYIAKREKFNGLTGIMNTVRLWDTFRGSDSTLYNTLGPARGMAGFDYPWQDYKNFRQNRIRKKMFFRYQNRAYFFVPYDQVPVVLNTEELATLWHFPNSAVQTPGLSRVPARRAEAPPNLPVLES